MGNGASQSVIFTCPKCGKSYRVPGAAVGKRVKCIRCGESVVIAAPPAPGEPLMMQQPSPPETQVPQEPAAGRAAANLAEAIKRRKQAGKKRKIVMAVLATIGGLIIVVCAFVLPSGPPDKGKAGTGASTPSTPAATEAPEITKLIADLGSTDNSVRSTASFKLGERLDQAAFSVPALKQAMEKEQNVEVRTEMEKALARLRSK